MALSRSEIAAKIREAYDDERGFGVGEQANEHVIEYWRLKVKTPGDLQDPAASMLLTEALLKTRSFGYKGRRK